MSEEYVQRLEEKLDRVLRHLSNPPPPDPMLDVDGVAERLGISKRSVERLIAKGDLKPIRIGGQRRFDAETIESYIRRCAERPIRGKRRRRAT